MGSCQYWTDDVVSLRDEEKRKVRVPPIKVLAWNRATYLQRFFDNLIANEDRNTGDILIKLNGKANTLYEKETPPTPSPRETEGPAHRISPS